MPVQLDELIQLSKNKFTELLHLECAEIRDELSHVEGFIDDVQMKEKENDTRLREVIASNKNLKTFLIKVEELKQHLVT